VVRAPLSTGRNGGSVAFSRQAHMAGDAAEPERSNK
jgi:hypothetical protein